MGFEPYPTRIRHFLIRTLAKLEMNKETNTFLITQTECKVIKEYLDTLKKYINKDIMKIIYSEVTECFPEYEYLKIERQKEEEEEDYSTSESDTPITETYEESSSTSDSEFSTTDEEEL